MTDKNAFRGARSWGRGLAAAAIAVGGGLSMAAAANAQSTIPSLSLESPATIYAAGSSTSAELLTVTGTNTAVGALDADLTDVTIKLTGLPDNVLCSSVTLTALSGAPVLTAVSPGATGTCSWEYAGPYTLSAGDTESINYQVEVDTRSPSYPNGREGTVTWTASANVNYSPAQPNDDHITSNSDESDLVAQAPPRKVADAPAATVRRAYDVQVIEPGSPRGVTTVTNVSANTPVPPTTCPAGQLGATLSHCYQLNNGLQYNELTGHIFRSTPVASYTPNLNPPTYRINVNNTLAGPPTSENLGIATVTVVIPNLFVDVAARDPFAEAIYTLGGSGVLSGYADGTFRPTTAVSRQAFAHFLWEAFGETDGACTTIEPSAFSDVPNSSQFCRSITGLSQRGVIKGYEDGDFHPTTAISRQAFAAQVYRAYNFLSTGNTEGVDAACTEPYPFSDVNNENPFCGDIQFMKEMGLSKGYSDGTFHPTAPSSRQATAQFIYGLMSSAPSGWSW